MGKNICRSTRTGWRYAGKPVLETQPTVENILMAIRLFFIKTTRKKREIKSRQYVQGMFLIQMMQKREKMEKAVCTGDVIGRTHAMELGKGKLL